MEDWQRQQKALKDADRQQKKGAANNLQNYRGTHQATWARKQKELKEADQRSRDIALASLKSYRGGEHDIKEYERMVAKYRQQLIEQSRERHQECHLLESESSPGQYEDAWREVVEEHIKEFEQLAAEHALQQFQSLEGSPRRKYEAVVRNAFPDATCQEFSKKGESLNSDGFPDEEKALDLLDQEPSIKASDLNEALPLNAEEQDEEEKGQESDEAQGRFALAQSFQSEAKQPDLLGARQDPQDDHLANPAIEQKQLVELDFSFGLIYGINSPPPSMESCSAAAERIVPVSLGRTLQHTLPNSSWDSTFRAVVKSVKIDPRFDGQGRSNRYVVKGMVPIHISVGELSSSFHTRSLDGPRSELIIGRKDEPRWRRVRTADCPSWESILTQKIW